MSLLITRERNERVFLERKREAEKELNERIEAAIQKEISDFFDTASFDYTAHAAISKANLLGFDELCEEMQSELNSSIDFDF